MSTTRIYQGRIVQARFSDDKNLPQDTESALSALETTNLLFQDAINYHMVALAGMAGNEVNTLESRFKERIRAIWEEIPRSKEGACSLQCSIARTLDLPSNVSFDDAVAYIFDGCERMDVLPYVEHYIIERTRKGAGAIQQQGREILPKLCNPAFTGNFDYSIKERRAAEGKRRLQYELNRPEITEEELRALAQEMDLSWVLKTVPNEIHDASLYCEQHETEKRISNSINEILKSAKNGKIKKSDFSELEDVLNLYESIKSDTEARPPMNGKLLAKKSPGRSSVEVEQAAIYFMFYPGKLSGRLLATKIGKEKAVRTNEESEYDFFTLENDPIILARGKRGYIYKGFTALPNWESSDGVMYSVEWDILSFKEALKTLHGFELKMKERTNKSKEYEEKRKALEEGKPIKNEDGKGDEDEGDVVELNGDPRFDLMKQLVREISPDEETEYHISSRTLNDYDEVRKKWLETVSKGDCSSRELVNIVREYQAKSKSFGSALLFETLCRDEYQCIWREKIQEDGKPRSKNVVLDFSRWQNFKEQEEKYKGIVRVTAADVVASPRQMMYSDIEKFGDGKGAKLEKNSGVRLQVAIRNAEGRWESAPIHATFSAPRFVRDEMTSDTDNWEVGKKENNSLPWLQPMLKALGEEVAPVRLEKTPAIGLQVKGRGSEARFYLNFPVSLSMEELQKSIGKSARWKDQFLRDKDEKLHLHWPSTIKKNIPMWWENSDIQAHGITVLGVDLGLRSSSAWALAHVNNEPISVNSRGVEIPGILMGNSLNKKWYGYVLKQGFCRLPGESPRMIGKTKVPAVSLSSSEDKQNAKFVFEKADIPFNDKDVIDVLQLGNKVLKCFKRLLSRLKIHLSFMAGMKSDERKEKIWERIDDYYSDTEKNSRMKEALKRRDEQEAYALLSEEVEKLRNIMPRVAENVTALILPRKRGSWVWHEVKREGWQGSGVMTLLENQGRSKRPIYSRGGLSVERLLQLETLRQRLQSMSRVLAVTPGEPVPFGRSLGNQKIIDPCPDILQKIENVREQRVNQIAHDIVAQALGVRLIPSRGGKNANGLDVIHGEYERVPDRKPVDFVVMENLSRYLTSLDRSREENSSLMLWSHRQIALKVKQLLEEVFGIPVIFTHAHYTSRFDSKTSEPGFRPDLMNPHYFGWIDRNGSDLEKKVKAVYSAIWEEVKAAHKQHMVTLLLPHRNNAGEYFLSHNNGKFSLRNADVNAATNIAWRGIAAPESLHLLHRVRMENKKSGVSLVLGNERDKARKSFGWKLKEQVNLNTDRTKFSAFAVPREWRNKACFSYGDDKTDFLLCHGKVVWGYIKANQWRMCHLFNISQLRKVGIETRLIEKFVATETEEDDNS